MESLNRLKSTFLKNDGDIKKLTVLVSTGNAMLFVGAGFSKDCLNIEGENPPLASQLSKKIGGLIINSFGSYLSESETQQIKENKNLMFTSDFYLNSVDDKSPLIELLKRNFTIIKTPESHVNICKLKWRRIYTTNYDNAIEHCLAAAGKTVTSLDLNDAPNLYRDSKDICLHINGKLDKLNAGDFIDRIKLSTSSYVSPDQFLESAWSNQFRRDIENCSAIVFVGYSMYDMDIKKILFANQHLINKTFFITRPDANLESIYNLKSYGEVLKLGVSGFGESIEDCIDASNTEESLDITFALERFIEDTPKDSYEIRDIEVNNFLLYGNISNDFINHLTSTNEVKNKFIFREGVDKVSSHLEAGSNILITSDLGNGKSIFLKFLISRFTKLGYDCYTHLKSSYDISKDLEAISRNKRKSIIFIDDYSNVIDDVKLIIEMQYPNVQLVISTRYYGYESTKHVFSALSMEKFKSHVIDNLSNQELEQFINIIHNLGAWGDKAGLPTSQKLQGLDINGKYQLSVLLLTILQSPFIKAKIDEISSNIFKNKAYKDTVFMMLLLDVMGEHYDRAIISDLSRNEEIYSPAFLIDVGVSNIFRIENGVIKAKSSTFAIFLLNNSFESTYIASKLLDLVGYLDALPENSKEKNYDEMKKSLLRFSLVEKILPKKRTEIKYYYEKLKERVKWLTNDPHYWVQYAMAMIPFKDYAPAQTFINTAYSLAGNKNKGYHTNNIDTQQARLYLLKALEASPQEAFSLFKSADDLINAIPNDIYKYRQVNRYDDIYKKKFQFFSKGDKVYFEQSCKRLIIEAQKAIDNPIGFYANDFVINKVRENLIEIVENISSSRS